MIDGKLRLATMLAQCAAGTKPSPSIAARLLGEPG